MDIDIDRLKAIEARLNGQGRKDWAPIGPQGQMLSRVPLRMSRPEIVFASNAPNDIAYLLDVIQALAGGEETTALETPTTESPAAAQADAAGGANPADGEGAAVAKPAKKAGKRG